jgi:hypothetical protein
MKRLLIVLISTFMVACSSEAAGTKPVKDEPKTYKFTGNVRDDAVKVYDDVNNANTTKEMYDEDYVNAFMEEYGSLTGKDGELIEALDNMAALAKLTVMGSDGEQDTYEKVRAEAWSIISE